LAPTPNPQSPIPNPQSPLNYIFLKFHFMLDLNINLIKYYTFIKPSEY